MKLEGGKLSYWNGRDGRAEEEKIYGGAFVDLLYGNPLGRALAPLLTRNAALSRAYGWLQSHGLSAGKVDPFVKKFGIQLDQFEGYPYKSFNDFFVRPFKAGQRAFAQGAELPAFCEARYSFFEKSAADLRLGVKGTFLDPAAILGSPEIAQDFLGGPVAVARLCPVDYHRYHFPDDGKILSSRRIAGYLDSVNPLSLLKLAGVFAENERHLTVVETATFGKLAFVDVGATCVGKIIQNKRAGDTFARGEERGYFLFGGSTVVVFGQPGRFEWKAEFLAKCREGWEVWLPLGAAIATAK